MVRFVFNKLNSQKAHFRAYRTNRKGANLDEKYLILESDDWGAIRTPSREALRKMAKTGFDFKGSVYQYDALASSSDLDALFDLLSGFRDADGRSLILTANAIMANPAFEKIKESDYKEYHFERFTETFKRYPEHEGNWRIWQNAICQGIFQPQFHGREHLQTKRWMRALQTGESLVRTAFDLGSTYSGREDYSFMEAFDWDRPEEVAEQEVILREGLDLFHQIFGFRSRTFIAPCYNWDEKLEPCLADAGVQIIQTLRNQLAPTGAFDQYRTVPHFFGERNDQGLLFSVRNAFLEPSLNPTKDWVDSCLAQIASAFYWKKPAVVCTHRLNYVGFIDPKNSSRGLNSLQRLIREVQRKWPEVKFISTDQLISKLQ